MSFNLQRLLALKDKRAIPPPAPAQQPSETEREALFREIRSTLARRELNPLDVSAALSSLLEAGLSQAEIARCVGRSPAYVSTYLELATLPEALERLVREGRLRDPSTVVVLKRLFAECPDEAEAQIRRAMREKRDDLPRRRPQTSLRRKQRQAPAPHGHERRLPRRRSRAALLARRLLGRAPRRDGRTRLPSDLSVRAPSHRRRMGGL